MVFFRFGVFLSLSAGLSLCTAQSILTTVPLAIRNPHFNCWTIGSSPGSVWPGLWNRQILGWDGLVRIDGVTWQWLGDTWVSGVMTPILNQVQFSSTQTIYSFQAGNVTLKVTYLSPIEVKDLARQSLPFSYVAFEATSNDQRDHNIQVYSDISAEWCSGDRSSLVIWNTGSTAKNTYHRVQLQNPTPFAEHQDQAEDATVYFSMPKGPKSSARINIDNVCRSQFVQTGSLSGSDSVPPGIISEPFQVFSFAMDLGNITGTSTPIVWSLGVVRNVTIYSNVEAENRQMRYPYYVTRWSNVLDALDYFAGDFSNALNRATDLDNQVSRAANSRSNNYEYLASLAMRQTIGSIEVTISKGNDGNWNMSDIQTYMKDVGSSRRVNPVEVLFDSLPFFLYMNSSYCGHLLSPLLEFQNSRRWSQPYAARDLGKTTLIISADMPHDEGIDRNMLIMAFAHASAAFDKSLITQHYDLLKNWANYLVDHSMNPLNQSSPETGGLSNSTNISLKGILGIKSMSGISRMLQNSNDAGYFSHIASTYAASWHSNALTPESENQHVLPNFGDPSSAWSLAYNFYADRLLGLDIIELNVYQQQSAYYDQLFSTMSALPVNSMSAGMNFAWTMFAAATVTDSTIQNQLIGNIKSNILNAPFFPYLANTTDGTWSGVSSPAQGAMLALLAPARIYGAQAGFQAIGSRDRTGSIVGGVVGGIVLVASVILVYVFWRRRARIQKDGTETETGDILYSRAVPYEYRNLEQIDEDGRPATLESSRSHGTPQGTNATPRVIPSSKERVAPTQSGTPPNLTAPSSPGLEGTAVFVPAVGRVSGGPTPDYTGLRSEVDNLRRVVRELQTERLDAPPNYQDIHNQSAPRTPQAVPQSADPEANGSGDGKPFWRRRASL
ncbi:hypothetical protein NLI96_g9611 [Meripilus lineatus]|uniref:DUF1793-domain-containing protein n=1 Tax=Meripilus lineatus TaxID=2056292 RepID=A0AAD5YCR9_9APHY|nr:hypothetical protein NLI96_g9611 [Physisporinus lineatus]